MFFFFLFRLSSTTINVCVINILKIFRYLLFTYLSSLFDSLYILLCNDIIVCHIIIPIIFHYRHQVVNARVSYRVTTPSPQILIFNNVFLFWKWLLMKFLSCTLLFSYWFWGPTSSLGYGTKSMANLRKILSGVKSCVRHWSSGI